MRLSQGWKDHQGGHADERDPKYADSTPRRLPYVRSTLRALICASALLLAGGAFSSQALADGDPASDVLATQPLFLPWDANVPSGEQASLASVIASAQDHGFPIRVALISSASDLGSVTALWGRPAQYAQFLGQELSLVYTGPLLVVMPRGFGLHGFTMPPAALESTLAGISAPSNGAQLAQVTITAIERLAVAADHPLPSTAANSGLRPSGGEGRIGAGEWVAFLLGCVAIAAAWSASLRARPLGRRREISP